MIRSIYDNIQCERTGKRALTETQSKKENSCMKCKDRYHNQHSCTERKISSIYMQDEDMFKKHWLKDLNRYATRDATRIQ